MSDDNIKYDYVNPIVNNTGRNSKRRIYHYTSADGLQSILEKGRLRFSDVQFLNDKSEYNYILKPLKIVCDSLVKSYHISYLSIEQLLEKNYEFRDLEVYHKDGKLKFNSTNMRYYIFCASKQKDSLGMWNYYVKNGNYQGYNLGFTINQMLNCFDTINESKVSVLYGDVIYDESMQIEILSALLNEKLNRLEKVIEILKKQPEEKRDINIERAYQQGIGEIIDKIEGLRLFFKDVAFKNEEEFRFVMKIPSDNAILGNENLGTGYTIKNGIFTPYCDIAFDKQKTISSIMISPIMEDTLARNGLERAIQYYNCSKDIKIDQSSIPIRY